MKLIFFFFSSRFKTKSYQHLGDETISLGGFAVPRKWLSPRGGHSTCLFLEKKILHEVFKAPPIIRSDPFTCALHFPSGRTGEKEKKKKKKVQATHTLENNVGNKHPKGVETWTSMKIGYWICSKTALSIKFMHFCLCAALQKKTTTYKHVCAEFQAGWM